MMGDERQPRFVLDSVFAELGTLDVHLDRISIDACLRGCAAVSYTHLDVYKRQDPF